MRRRGNALREAVARLRPQVLIIEHYPFSKWELEGEIGALIAAARAACPQLIIVGSLRDILLQTSLEDCSAEYYVREVLRRVERDFDALMVHGEERLTPLDRSFAGTSALRVPLCYTGIVAEARAPVPVAGKPYVLVSSGGGSDPLRIAEAVSAALSTPRLAEVARDHELIVCQALTPGSAPLHADVRRFNPDFLGLLAGASLSVSYAGYNTCANLLTMRRRALLAVHPGMSDQAARAALMESLGAAMRVPADRWAAGPLADLMASALAEPLPVADAQLDGAERSVSFIEWLWEKRRSAPASVQAKKTPL
jgi:predicted glycosyltransferase